MYQLMTVLAVPFEAVQSALRARHFDDHADGSFLQSLRRMAHVLGQKKDFALFDWNFKRRLARSLHEPKKNIALQLIEKFFGRIVMIIAPIVGPAHNRDHHLAVFPNLRISYWRLEFFSVLFDPAHEVESLQVS